MSSVGQAAGYLVGGAVGFFAGGNVMLGAQIGGMIGGYIDPPKGAHQYGPRLDDKSVQTASYGQSVPDVYGEYRLKGNVIWVKNNRMDESSETTGGGKGGSKPKQTTYSYSMTFAVALCLGPIDAVKSIRVGSKLLFTNASSDLASIIAQNNSAAGWKIYYGTDDQMPDPAMEAALGAGNCPAYRGIAYIVFYDLPMADYGNSPMGAQVEVVVIKKAVVDPVMPMVADWTYEPTLTYAFGDDPYETWGSTTDWATYTRQGLYESNRLVSVKDDPIGYASGAGAFDMDGAWSMIGGPYGPADSRIIIEGNNYAYFDPSNVPRYTQRMRKIDGKYYALIYDSPAVVPDYRISLVEIQHGEIASTLVREKRFDFGEFGFLGDQFGSILTDGLTPATVRIRLYDAEFNTVEERIFTGAPSIGFWSPGVWSTIELNYNAWMSGRRVFVAAGTTSYENVVVFDMDTGASEMRELGGVANFIGPAIFRVYPGEIVKMACGLGGIETKVYMWAPAQATAGVQMLDEVVSARCLKSRLTSSDIDVTELSSDVVRGYMTTGEGSLRGSIEPLQRVFPFDAIQDGYKLKFVRRPHSPVLTIDEVSLGASDGGIVNRLTETREMDGQLPCRVSVRYPDINREFDVNEQYDARLNTSSVNETAIDTTVVLTANEAAGVAQQTLYRGWVERSDYRFKLPDAGDFRKLQPADVVTVQTGDSSHEILIRQIETLPNGIREFSGVRNSSAVYSPTAIGATGAFTPSVVAGFSKTAGILLDIPAVDSSQNSPSMLVGMRGYASWPGGTLFISRDSGATWEALADAPAGKTATMGYAETALPDANTCAMVDTRGTLQVRISSGETLAGITRDQLLNWGNLFAVGAPGRWELIQAQDVASVSADVYTLSRFLRGRFGTEWATGTHQVGDSVVLLDTDLVLSRLQSSDFDVSALYKFVTRNQNIDEARDETVVFGGTSLECLSPVNVKYHKTAAGDVVVSATRRTRHDGVWRNYADVPLNEESERYSGLIYEDASYSRVVRSFDGLTSCGFTYTAAQQALDFPALPDPIYLEVCQVSAHRGRGYPARKTIQFGDPLWANVTIALHCDGLNGSTVLTDMTGRVWTHLGGLNTISTVESKFGGASAGLDFISGTSTGWRSPADAGTTLGANNFSIRFWFKPVGGSNTCIAWHGSLPSSVDWSITLGGAGTTPNFLYANGSSYGINFGTIPDRFAYYEWTRSGSTDYIFIDGILAGSQPAYASVQTTAGAYTYFMGASATYGAYGYVDDFTLTNGAARNTTNYTPPNSPFKGA